MDFSNVKVGDRLYSLSYGEVRVMKFDRDTHYPVRCDMVGQGGCNSWTLDGKLYMSAKYPDLYFSKPQIIGGDVPPKRKRKTWNKRR